MDTSCCLVCLFDVTGFNAELDAAELMRVASVICQTTNAVYITRRYYKQRRRVFIQALHAVDVVCHIATQVLPVPFIKDQPFKAYRSRDEPPV